MSTATELNGLRDENRTLYGVIKLVSSSVELGPMLQGIVDLATQATDCHACFIYLLEDDQLTIRAASQVFADAVGRVQLAIEEGLTGWVARHRTPEFIRERAMDDPRMKYVPLLQEERFQSMVAVPILSRSSDTLGVIVLHTEAPREFTEDTLKLLVHIASLVSGAIENAQLYERERRRVDALTRLAGLGGEVASATDADDLGLIVARRHATAARGRVLPGLSPGPRRQRPAAADLRPGHSLLAADALGGGVSDRRARRSRLGVGRTRPVAGP